MNEADVTKLGYIGKVPGTLRKSDDWYTPKPYIDMCTEVLDGIDLDPFSSDHANKNVGAKKYWTEKDNALKQDWSVDDTYTVFMNPPYSRGAMKPAVDKFIEEYQLEHFVHGIVLVNNATESVWFQSLLEHGDAACFVNHRISFWNAEIFWSME